ncbi:MAG: glutamine synthetase type III [Ruminococcaceae bacterium]|nr:glutamine synthetase type III [Oscillospiraceae bacterium]
MNRIPELFGTMVFGDEAMRERLPAHVYESFRRCLEARQTLDLDVADAMATAMKDWAVEHGATHYTHWFQPMTGVTAEKHDSFISPTDDGKIIMDFSGKELVKGEPDASSFPSGGLRATFEARGYTAWDPSSYAFIKDGTLCIPTIFYSYGGSVLDKKTPLLRSSDALDRQARRILALFGNTDVNRVITSCGAEQEYFLIDKELHDCRRDLMYCGRTLFGAKPPKGQELDDHYFGAIKPRVQGFMNELNLELWKLGVYSKTEHNEVAPAQHELAPVFTDANRAADHNQLTMELMKTVAARHGLTCLLHEKPFAGVNGSGKHDNWSICTDTGENLLNPGTSPQNNARFLLFLVAMIKAVDEHQDLLRVSVATAGNDHRLGGNEAPPAIISIFLGDELTDLLETLEKKETYDPKDHADLNLGVDVLPRLRQDTTDRNRTSPFAFTGNKFEFRMLGSAISISCPNTILNTIMADTLMQFADELEGAEDFSHALNRLIRRTYREHKRIIFNGNNYSDEWTQEAEKRGLLNLKTTADALPYYISDKNVALFGRHAVYSENEVHSRYEILMEGYAKTLKIEAHTMLEMARKDIFPAVCAYMKDLSSTAMQKKSILPDLEADLECSLLTRLSKLSSDLYRLTETLEADLAKASTDADCKEVAEFYRDIILPDMQNLREVADEIEMLTGADYWPYPTYGDLLFHV